MLPLAAANARPPLDVARARRHVATHPVAMVELHGCQGGVRRLALHADCCWRVRRQLRLAGVAAPSGIGVHRTLRLAYRSYLPTAATYLPQSASRPAAAKTTYPPKGFVPARGLPLGIEPNPGHKDTFVSRWDTVHVGIVSVCYALPTRQSMSSMRSMTANGGRMTGPERPLPHRRVNSTRVNRART